MRSKPKFFTLLALSLLGVSSTPNLSQIASAVAVRPASVSSTSVSGWQNTNIIAVKAGGKGACAIQGSSPTSTSGVLYCWGTSTVLGTGATSDSNVPVQVSAANGFTNTAVTAVALNEEHACAIESGQVWCWGAGYATSSFGVLGAGATTSRTPVKVSANAGFDNDGASGDDVTAIDVTYARSCAIEGGQVFCWGDNMFDRLGIGPSGGVSSNVPQRVVDTSPAGFQAATATSLSVGFSHVCAVASGSAYCWGINYDNQLGNTTPGAGLPTKVAQGSFVTSNSNVTAIGLGNGHSCAIQSGKLYCWGTGLNYRTGSGATSNVTTPAAVVAGGGFLNTSNVTAVAGGEKHTCAIESGKLYCWGNNADGQLGDNSTTEQSAPVLVSASDVPGFTNNGQVTAVSAASGGGYGFTCAIESMVVYCWGTSMDGRLGAGQVYGNQKKPVKVFVASAPSAPSGLSTMTGNGQLTVSFSKPSDGGSTITGYEYTLDNGATTTSFTSSSNYVSVTIQNLTNGTQYSIKVRAINAVGTSAWSNAVNGTPSASSGGGGSSSGGGGSGGSSGGSGGPQPTTVSGVVATAVLSGTTVNVTFSNLPASALTSVRITTAPASFDLSTPQQGLSFTTYTARVFSGSSLPTVSNNGFTVAISAMLKLVYTNGTPGAPIQESFASGGSYQVAYEINGSASSTYLNGWRAWNNQAPSYATLKVTETSTTTTATAAPATTSISATTVAETSTTTVANVFAAAKPGITVTDSKVYTAPPVEVSASSAINVLTPAQAKVMDIQTKTPAICLPNDDELVFLDEGKCIAEVVNAKTRAVLRVLKTTVVADDISEVKVGNAIVTLAPVYFDAMSSTLDAKDMALLRSIKSKVSAAGSVLVIGHSGTLNGNSPANVAISRARAMATVAALKSIGAKGPFALSGVGALDPASNGKTEAAQAKNRRVVIALIP